MPQVTPRAPLAILFDLDGTLVDSIALILASFRYTFAAHGIPALSDAEIAVGIGTPLATQFRPYARDDSHLSALIESYREHQREQHDLMLREYAGMRDMLAALRRAGHQVAVVTSKGLALAQRALDFTGLTAHIDALVGLESTEHHKPRPEPVLHAMSLLRRETADAIFVGDSPHDIAAGRAAGVPTIAVTWGAFNEAALSAAQPTYLVHTVPELTALIDGLQVARGQAEV
ncbi:MAG: HAD-IA family hydrolase [Gemmatimonadota bacterium]|nr:HAD-IA family hydrolase [Gemmatimonadota bacterium]